MAALRFDTAGKTKPEVLKTFPDCLHKVDSDNTASPRLCTHLQSDPCLCHQNDSVHNEDEVSKFGVTDNIIHLSSVLVLCEGMSQI